MRQADIDHCIAALSIARTGCPLKKITDTAHNRMLNRTAKEQHAAMLEALRGPDEIPPSDADDASASRSGVLS